MMRFKRLACMVLVGFTLSGVALLKDALLCPLLADAAVLNGFELHQQPGGLAVVLKTSQRIAYSSQPIKNATGEGLTLTLEDTELDPAFKTSGLPVVLDEQGRFLGRAVPLGNHQVRLILPNFPSQRLSLSVRQQVSVLPAAKTTEPTQPSMPVKPLPPLASLAFKGDEALISPSPALKRWPKPAPKLVLKHSPVKKTEPKTAESKAVVKAVKMNWPKKPVVPVALAWAKTTSPPASKAALNPEPPPQTALLAVAPPSTPASPWGEETLPGITSFLAPLNPVANPKAAFLPSLYWVWLQSFSITELQTTLAEQARPNGFEAFGKTLLASTLVLLPWLVGAVSLLAVFSAFWLLFRQRNSQQMGGLTTGGRSKMTQARAVRPISPQAQLEQQLEQQAQAWLNRPQPEAATLVSSTEPSGVPLGATPPQYSPSRPAFNRLPAGVYAPVQWQAPVRPRPPVGATPIRPQPLPSPTTVSEVPRLFQPVTPWR